MCFMQFVPTRAKATLLPIIEQFIRLGTLKITYMLNWQAIDEANRRLLFSGIITGTKSH